MLILEYSIKIQIIIYKILFKQFNMPSIDYFECEDCGFRWKDQGPLMFCLNDDGEIEEYILVQEAYDLDKDSQISGDIVETYCSCCEKRQASAAIQSALDFIKYRKNKLDLEDE